MARPLCITSCCCRCHLARVQPLAGRQAGGGADGRYIADAASASGAHGASGSVKVGRSDPIRESWIGIAPFIGGTVAILLLASWQFGVELQPALSLGLILDTMASSLQAPDALLWLYLLFSISNAMLPSESDRQPWLSALLFLGVVAAIVYILASACRYRLRQRNGC